MDVYLVFDGEGRLVEVTFKGAGGRCRQYMAEIAERLRELGASVEVKEYRPDYSELAAAQRAQARARARA